MANVYENERRSLIQKLHDSVKQCQATFGAKINLATENDSCVVCVIVHFEQVLLHGLKKSSVWEKITSISEPLRQVTQKMLPEIEVTFWSLLKEYLGPLDVQHFQNLKGITSDSGRARVWLRTSLNENSLERHLNSILGHATLCMQFYEPWALMMDEEKASTIPTMARGLGSILFAIDTKSPQLNLPFKSVFLKSPGEQDIKTHRRIKSNPLPVMAEKLDNDLSVNESNIKKKKKRKVVEATINDAEIFPAADETCSSYSEHCSTGGKGNNEGYYSSAPDVTKIINEDKLKINYGDKDETLLSLISEHDLSSDVTFSLDIDNECVISQLETLNISLRNLEIDNSIANKNLRKDIANNILDAACIPRENSDSSNILIKDESESNGYSIDNLQDVIVENMQKVFTSDIVDTEVSLITNVLNPNNNATDGKEAASSPYNVGYEDETNVLQVGSESSKYLQIIAFDQESSQAINNTLALVSASNTDSIFITEPEEEMNQSYSEIEKYIPKFPPPGQNTTDDLSTLSIVDLKQAILATGKKKDEVEERRRVLQCMFDEQHEELCILRSEHETLQNEIHEKDEKNEKKIQELYHEIEILKNQLKKYVAAVQLLRKDKIINEETKGAINDLYLPPNDIVIPPVPKERSISENDSIFEDKLMQMAEMHGELLEFQESLQRQLVSRDKQISSMKQQLVSLRGPLPQNQDSSLDSTESSYSPTQMLINIWIPSVFLQGKGSDSYHVYQIYLRIGDEEWNIYRRYSQFDKLHMQICKLYPVLEKSNFPKKKMFGKKDNKLVEERRRRLQEYLRTLINIFITNNPELASTSNKRKLVEILPFFGENFDANDDKKKNGKKVMKNPQYTGL